jgi:hypothetical protein
VQALRQLPRRLPGGLLGALNTDVANDFVADLVEGLKRRFLVLDHANDDGPLLSLILDFDDFAVVALPRYISLKATPTTFG